MVLPITLNLISISHWFYHTKLMLFSISDSCWNRSRAVSAEFSSFCGKLDKTSISIVAAVVLSVAGNILLCALALVSFGIPPAESSLAATSLATMIFDIADTGWFDIKTRDSASGFKKEDGRLSAMVSVHLIPLPAP